MIMGSQISSEIYQNLFNSLNQSGGHRRGASNTLKKLGALSSTPGDGQGTKASSEHWMEHGSGIGIGTNQSVAAITGLSFINSMRTEHGEKTQGSSFVKR